MTLFQHRIEAKIELTLKTTLNSKMVRGIKSLQGSYNADANEILRWAKQENRTRENMDFLVNLATISMVVEYAKPTEDKLQTFNKPWKHPDLESQNIAKGHTKRIQ